MASAVLDDGDSAMGNTSPSSSERGQERSSLAEALFERLGTCNRQSPGGLIVGLARQPIPEVGVCMCVCVSSIDGFGFGLGTPPVAWGRSSRRGVTLSALVPESHWSTRGGERPASEFVGISEDSFGKLPCSTPHPLLVATISLSLSRLPSSDVLVVSRSFMAGRPTVVSYSGSRATRPYCKSVPRGHREDGLFAAKTERVLLVVT